MKTKYVNIFIYKGVMFPFTDEGRYLVKVVINDEDMHLPPEVPLCKTMKEVVEKVHKIHRKYTEGNFLIPLNIDFKPIHEVECVLAEVRCLPLTEEEKKDFFAYLHNAKK